MAAALAVVACAEGDGAVGDNATGTVKAPLGIGTFDFGADVEANLQFISYQLFGIKAPITDSAPSSSGAVRALFQPASDLMLLADGLEVNYLTREAANHADMAGFWPNDDDPRFIVFCIESGREIIGVNGDGSDKYNPSVQRINLATGKVDTVLRGMDRCDGARTTPWGTVLVTEETTTGGAYEILNPTKVDNATITDRGGPGEPATITDPLVVKRPALPTIAWEGLTVHATGVVIGGDELRPGSTGSDTDGGAVFKFVPASPRTQLGNISSLDTSPLAAGSVYAFQASCVEGRQQVGQGCEIGAGAWIPVGAATAREDADAGGATGYYRPEDLHSDPLYSDSAKPLAIRFCWNNTGNEGGSNFAEVVCAVDENVLTADPDEQTVVANRFIEGDSDFNSFDNLAFQPVTGNLYVIEDHPNGDIFACLKDGADRDIKSDGCVKVLSLTDSSAEPTGFVFSPDGKTAYLSIQHSRDDNMPLVDDYPTDDIVAITGFELE